MMNIDTNSATPPNPNRMLPTTSISSVNSEVVSSSTVAWSTTSAVGTAAATAA